MAIVVITTTPDANVVLQAGVLDEQGVTIINNTVTRDLTPGGHLFRHTIEGPVGASCGITITQAGGILKTVSPGGHTIVPGEPDDSIPVTFTVR